MFKGRGVKSNKRRWRGHLDRKITPLGGRVDKAFSSWKEATVVPWQEGMAKGRPASINFTVYFDTAPEMPHSGSRTNANASGAEIKPVDQGSSPDAGETK